MADTTVGDLDADLEFLMRAVRKVEAIREDLGKVGPVIADQVEEAMLGRRSRLDTKRAEAEAEPVRRLFKFERDLAKQIKALTDKLHETKRELRLDPENVQKVVEVALELAGQPPLEEAKVPGLWPDPKRKSCPVFRLPALSGSWEQCAEGLAHPFTGEARPFVFDHALSKGREDVVLVHLNHRLVQMSLRLLRAEVWSPEGRKKKLNRVTARVVPDSALQHLAVVAHARLVVIGGDSQRLHEEIISAGGQIREGRFSRFGVAQGDAGRPRRRHRRGAVRGGEAEAARPLAQDRRRRCIRPSKPARRTGRTASRRCSPSGPTRRCPTSRRS